jgi:hypothetical protein
VSQYKVASNMLFLDIHASVLFLTVSSPVLEQNIDDADGSGSFVFGPWEKESDEELLRRVVALGFKVEAIKTECSDRGLSKQFSDGLSSGRSYYDGLRWNLVNTDIALEDGEMVGGIIDCKNTEETPQV